MTTTNEREILLAVTGGIAAYKAAALASRLVQAGYGVSAMMTRAAAELLGPPTLAALTGRPVELSLTQEENPIPHIAAARRAKMMVVAPATANILAKAACGLADDLVSATLLAFPGPILMAPAMNTVMWNKPATARSIRCLTEDGVHFVGPASGHLGCGDTGAGRMAEPEEIFAAIERLFPQ